MAGLENGSYMTQVKRLMQQAVIYFCHTIQIPVQNKDHKHRDPKTLWSLFLTGIWIVWQKYMTAVCVRFLLESSRTHFLGLPSPIQSGINCLDMECTVQNLPFESVFLVPRFLQVCGSCYSFNFWCQSTIFLSLIVSQNKTFLCANKGE